MPEALTIAEIAGRLLVHQVDLTWRRAAACVGISVDEFYAGEQRPGSVTVSTTLGRGKCAACAVRWDCLHEAVRLRERFGIWGGLDAHERERIRRRHPDVFNDIVGSESQHRVVARHRRTRRAPAMTSHSL